MDNAEKLIELIREKEMKPKARWHFTLKNSLALTAFIAVAIAGALAFSVILFAIQQSDFNLIAHMSHSIFEFMLGLIPLIWIIFLIVFLVLAIYSIKNSKKGYKFTSLSLIGFCTALSILAGTLFFISGGAGWLENAFATSFRQYESVEERKTKVWTMPEDGYLSGIILSVGDTTFKMEDFNGKSWTIEFREADIVPSIRIIDGEKIKMTGNMISDDIFKADKIRPWGGFQHRNHGGWKK
jgi:heme/copper-type cytochrome/quinol oxidase subunit 2